MKLEKIIGHIIVIIAIFIWILPLAAAFVVVIKNPDQYEQLIEKLLKELLKIHNLKPQLFQKIPIP